LSFCTSIVNDVIDKSSIRIHPILCNHDNSSFIPIRYSDCQFISDMYVVLLSNESHFLNKKYENWLGRPIGPCSHLLIGPGRG
jgi:hypothetical protein